METKFTPGPWFAVSNTDGAISIMPDMLRRKYADPFDPASYGFETGIGHAVAFVEGWTNEIDNARLIAAAPDLFAALQKAYSVLANIHHEWPGRNTREGQRLLCDMRDALSAASGIDAEEIQNKVAW